MASQGQTVFEDYCAACHLSEGEGMSGLAPALKTDLWQTLGPRAPTYFFAVVLNGLVGVPIDGEIYPNAMPPWDTLEDAELLAVGNYILRDLNGLDHGVSEAALTRSRGTAKTISEIKAMRKGG